MRIGLEEGQLVRTGVDIYQANYYLRDHLGNVRMVLAENGNSLDVLQETEYYPFGLAIPRSGADAVNKYQYNGKEKQPETGYLDYEARMYDPSIARWMVNDPSAEKYEGISPYSYAFDNPLRFIDIKGKDPGDVIVLFAGANLDPFAKDPYGITTSMKNMLAGNLNGGKVEKFLSNYVSLAQNKNGYDNSVYLQQNLDELTQEAYEKQNLEGDGRVGIYGYSWGGVLANHLAKRFEKEGINIDFLAMVDAANGPGSEKVDRSISTNVSNFANIYQENPSMIFSRGYPAKKISQKTSGQNINVKYAKDKSGKLVKVSHSNIDDDRLRDIVNSLIEQFNRKQDEN